MLSTAFKSFVKAWWVLYALFFSSITLAAEYGINIVVNGGAETGLTGWTKKSGNWQTRSSDPSPGEGSKYFFAGNSSGAVQLYQEIDLTDYSATINAGKQYVQINSLMAGWQSKDRAQQVFSFRDKNGKGLAYYIFGQYTSSKTWKRFSKVFKVPEGTVSMRVDLNSTRYSGSNNDAYHDDVQVIPLNPKEYQSNELMFNGAVDMPPSYGWKANKGRWDRRYSDPTAKDGGAYYFCHDTYGQLYQIIDVSSFSDTIDKGIQEFKY
ncbi:MAG: hypothetical protein OXE99_12735, partial [Cellvibrionales bacterium]|nr:hypothetical protein [Cellvibrionales bacterium]